MNCNLRANVIQLGEKNNNNKNKILQIKMGHGKTGVNTFLCLLYLYTDDRETPNWLYTTRVV